MSLPDINIVLKASTEGFRRGMAVVDGQLDKVDRSAGSASARIAAMGDRMASMGRRLSILTAGLAGVAGGAFLLAKNAAETGDAISDAASKAGVSTKYFQEMGYAMSIAADMTQDEFGAAMTKLTKNLGDAQQGSKGAIAAFDAIGISQSQIASGSVTTQQAFDAYVKKMGEMEDPAVAAAMSADLFGKAGAAMGAQLVGASGKVNDLVQSAKDMGIAMGPDFEKAAGQFDEKWKGLTASIEAVKVKIAKVLLPVLVNDLIPALTDKVIPAIGSIVESVAAWITAFGKLDPAIQNTVGVIVAGFGVGGPALVAISGLSTTILALCSGPAAPFVLLAASVVVFSTLFPEFGSFAESAFTDLGGAVVGSIKLIGELIKIVGKAEQAFVDLFKVSKSDIAGMSFSNPGGGADGTSGLGVFGGGGGMGDFPGGGTGGSNSTGSYGNGVAIGNGIINGYRDTMAARDGELRALADRLPQIHREQLGVNSPSTVFAEIGRFLGEGLSLGLTQSQSMVAAAVGTLATTATQSTAGMVQGVLGSLSTLFQIGRAHV